jgi:PAS domain S-box-containing protein
MIQLFRFSLSRPHRFVAKLEESTALRYALAPACVAVAVLLHLSVVGPFLHPTGLFLAGIVAAAWFGGAGPGFLAAVLATLVLPQFVPRLYPLIADFFDLPRFLTFALIGLAVGWGTIFRRRAEAALRQSEHELLKSRNELEIGVTRRTLDLRFSEERYARAMDASNDGLWEWNPMTDELFVSPRAKQLMGVPDGVEIRKRADLRTHGGFHPEDRRRISDTFRACLAPGFGGFDIEYRVINPAGELSWVRSRGKVFHGSLGQPTLLTGSLTDVTERKCAAAALSLSEERYARAMEAAEEGHWEWNMVTDEMFLSARMKEVLGLAPDAQFTSRADFFNRQPIHPDDRQRVNDAREASLSGTTPRYQIEYRVIPRPGELRWVRSRGKVFRDDQGRPVRITGSFTDITDRKLVNEALRRSEERFSLAIAGSSDGIWDWDILTDEMFYSERAQVLNGLKPGLSVRQRSEWRTMWKLHPDDVESQSRAIDDYVSGRAPAYDGEWRVRQLDGSYRWVRGRGLCVRDESGRATRMVGAISDIHARKCAEEALRFSEQRYALAMEASGEGHWDWNVATDEYYASPRMLELYGFPPETTFKGRSDFLARFPFHPEDRPRWEEAVAAHFSGKTARFDIEIRMIPRGETRWIHLTGLLLRNASGKPIRWTGSVADVTARRNAEEALRLSEHRYALAMEATGDGHWDWNIPADKMYVSPLLLDICGLPADTTFASRSAWVDRFPFYPGERPRYQQAVAEHFAGKTTRVDVEIRIVPRGETRWVHMTGRCSRDASGTPIRWAGSVTDVTARKRVEEELRARQEMLDLAQKAARAVAFEWRIGAGEGENRWSPDLEAMYGLAPGSYDGTYESWKKLVYPEDWPNVRAAISCAQESGDVAAEYRVTHKAGTIRWLQAKGRMFFDPEGNPSRVVGFMLDVTDRHLAEEELQRMEHQLRQAQRLEGMGTLAGGIAHDFNNLLGAILGYGEMALRDAPAGSRLRRDLESIMIAGERGRTLVDRILAFSRSGVGERVAVHVEEVVRETLELFAAKLPHGIVIEDRLRAGWAAVMGDATQIHQVLMNLVTNAAHAMPSGGILRVSLECATVGLPRAATTGPLAARDYVVLEVADTGGGIPSEVLERIFDPFFTTKEVGVGTGLGLSLVHGIVTGLGGAIDVVTNVGRGSVFTVYLPRAGDVTKGSKPRRSARPKTRRGDREQVLVVDDEQSLVELVTQTLTELGYAPVGFSASAAALEAFSADPGRFDAVITDESMPGTSGSDLIRKMRAIRPTLPIVLVSGYLSTAVVQRAREAGADEVLKKPLSARELATSLDRILHTKATRSTDLAVSTLANPAAKRRRRAAMSPSRVAPARRR